MEQHIEQDFYFQDALFKIFNVGQTSRLIKTLNQNGIRFFTNGHGAPFVSKSEFERKQPKKKPKINTETEWKPNVLKT